MTATLPMVRQGETPLPAEGENGRAVTAASSAVQLLTFSLREETFGVAILNVKEIIEYAGVTEVPMMPAFVRGVINLRGAVVPVIDIAVRFGWTPTVPQRRSCIVIVEVPVGEGKQEFGIIVDAVSEVVEVAGSEIEPPPTFGARIRSDFVAGIAKVNERFVIVLEMANLLSLEEMAELAAAANGARTRE
ncbi:MAG: chemotaxis protein CheW [Hydrogenophilus sp.]|nr:chemotaxis protein CheW [Hydrogenophilus sp.]